MSRLRSLMVAMFCMAGLASSIASSATKADDPKPDGAATAGKEKLYAKFKEMVVGTKWKGRFTVKGRELDKLTDEAYEVSSATKLDEGEMWLLKARVKYGGSDRTYPVPIEVLWAGDTPVLTMNKLTIPGVGTFSCRVVLDEGQYAGTWQHDKVGGHLFGSFEKGSLDDEPNPKASGDGAPPKDDQKPADKKPAEKK